jgi:hypothetical protein
MHRFTTPSRRLMAAALGTALLAMTSAARATDPPDLVIDFPAGVACSGFDLRLELWNGSGKTKELKEKDGYTRLLSSGLGATFLLTNLSNGKSLLDKAKGGSLLLETSLADGSTRYTLRGHALLIWLPTDLPAGPFTILNSGNLSFNASPEGVGSDLSVKGNTTDVCAALT